MRVSLGHILHFSAAVLLTLFCWIHAYAQDEPRYNRIQYHKYHWKAYQTKSYHIYFPAGNDSLCAFVVKELPEAIRQIKKRVSSADIKEVSIIIYPSTDQQYETNIGAHEPQQYTLPTFVSKGSRTVLAYNGSYDDLQTQLYTALSRQVWETQLQENTPEAQTQGVAKHKGKDANDIPNWYKEGAIRYLGNGWTIADEDALRLSFMQNHFTGYQQILSYEPKLGGLAFCYFLSQRYMPTTVAQTFTQFKKKKSLPRVIRLVTKRTLDTIYSQCLSFYQQRFSDTSIPAPVNTSSFTFPHRKGIIRNILLNPAQDLIAYIDYADNKRTVYMYDTIQKRAHRIATYQLAPWIDDHSRDQYPLIQWNTDGRQLFVAMPVKGKILIQRYTIDGQKQETTTLYGVDGITDMQPENNDKFLLAAYRKGQGDIVRYDDVKEQYAAFTDDSWDDAYPVLTGTKDGSDLYFVSDRPKKKGPRIYLISVGYKKDTLYQGIYHLKNNKLQLVAIDSASYIRWNKPVGLANGDLLVTHTKYGTERFAVLDPSSKQVTTLGHHQPIQYLPGTQRVASYRSKKDSSYIVQEPLQSWVERTKAKPSDTTSPWLTDHRKLLAKQAHEDSILNKAKDTAHYFADQILKPKPRKKKPVDSRDSMDNPNQFNAKKISDYILQLHSAYFTAKVNNDYFINRYQPYQANQGEFKFPEVGAMAQGGLTDVLENHHFTIAYRIPSATDGSLFFVKYENTAKKVDWGASYFRDVETLQPDAKRNWVDENGDPYPSVAKVKTHYYEVFFKHPLNYDCSLGFQTAIREDATIFLATDKRSLNFAPFLSTWSITTASYTMNKLQPTLPGLFKGFYLKAIVDGFKGFTQQKAALFGSQVNVAYHQPLYKYITLVTQLHAGYSSGQQKVLYNLGGVDNNVTPRVDSSVHFSQNAPYAFQTLITPFRGYYQNTLYGNEYLLVNADVYFPIFQTLIPIHTSLPSINNLQLGIFSDLATAKERWNVDPNSKWLLSYGLNARTVLAGYPLRVDMAYSNTGKKIIYYFSISM